MKKILIFYAAISFVLNFIWEMSQVGLYKPHFNGTFDLIFVHSRATAGDVTVLFFIYAIVGLIFRDAKWVAKNKTTPLLLAAFFGFIFAVVIEKYALSTGRWEYNETMPIIPYIKVGLSPILQLTVIPALVAFITGKYSAK